MRTAHNSQLDLFEGLGKNSLFGVGLGLENGAAIATLWVKFRIDVIAAR